MRFTLPSPLKSLLPKGKRQRRIAFGPARGAVLPLDLRYELRLFLGVYERELWRAYRRLLAPGMSAFDIGGRDGYSALVIHSLTRGPVVSFEADLACAEEMRRALALNPGPLRAVHARIGPGGIGLDEAAARFGEPDFVKIDVEGGEVEVLRSGRATIGRGAAMIIEVHGEAEERGCRELLRGRAVEVVEQARFFREARPLPWNRWLVCYGPDAAGGAAEA